MHLRSKLVGMAAGFKPELTQKSGVSCDLPFLSRNGLMDTHEKGSRLLRELSIMQGSHPQSDTAIPGVPPIPIKPE
jgi:hypothetical protein